MAEQAEHGGAPDALRKPAAQVEHCAALEEPAASVVDPAGHDVHAADEVAEYEPCPQGVHAVELASENEPAPHTTHGAEPLADM